jgi:hypothetical protein
MPKEDQNYVVDLCDAVLGLVGHRDCYKLDFLRGDPGKNGKCRILPVDAYYPDLRLVIEYRELQHSEPVAIMDRRPTVSGCSRGEQRKIYDERRRKVLSQMGYPLVEFDYTMFAHNARKRLRRDRTADLKVIQSKLKQFLK